MKIIKLENGTYALINQETGEMIKGRDEILKILKDEKSEIDRERINAKSKIDRMEKKLGVEKNTDSLFFNWNSGKNGATLFIKNYTTFQREIMKDMTSNEISLMSILSNYLENQSNEVLIENKRPSNKVLGDMLNIHHVTISNILTQLEDKNLIRKIGKGKGRRIFVNPQWAFHGKHLKLNTLNLFF